MTLTALPQQMQLSWQMYDKLGMHTQKSTALLQWLRVTCNRPQSVNSGKCKICVVTHGSVSVSALARCKVELASAKTPAASRAAL